MVWRLAAFTAGLALGASGTAGVLWLLGGLTSPVPDSVARAVLLGGVALLLLREFGLLPLPLPENRRLVPQAVLHKPGLRPALIFGIELGTGVRTYVPAVAPYLLALAILLLGPDWTMVLLVALGFALGRAVMPMARLLSGEPEAWDGLLERRLRLALLTRASATVTAVAVVWAAMGSPTVLG